MKTKYTLDFVLQEIKGLLKTLRENKDIVYIGELFENKSYSKQRYSEWCSKPNEDKNDRATRHGDNEDIAEMSVTIKEILESRAVTGAMKGELNATITIFHLKNNYKWKDKTESEVYGKGGKDLVPGTVSFIKPDPKEHKADV